MLAISYGRGSETSGDPGSPHSLKPSVGPGEMYLLLWVSFPHLQRCSRLTVTASQSPGAEFLAECAEPWAAGAGWDKGSCCSGSSGSLPGALHPHPQPGGRPAGCLCSCAGSEGGPQAFRALLHTCQPRTGAPSRLPRGQQHQPSWTPHAHCWEAKAQPWGGHTILYPFSKPPQCPQTLSVLTANTS